MACPQEESSSPAATGNEPAVDAPREKNVSTGLPPECEPDNLNVPHTEQGRRRAALELLAERMFDRRHGGRL